VVRPDVGVAHCVPDMTLPHAPLIQCAELSALSQSPLRRPLIVDCSFDLSDVEAGKRSHAAAHLPAAVYLHLEDDLSGPRTGRNGRHPLPERARFAQRMADLGADDETHVIAYDGSGGMYAARLWWMLRWAGHAAVSVLDGGIGAWRTAGYALEAGVAPPPARRGNFSLRSSLTRRVSFHELLQALPTGRHLVVDARAPERYRGEIETIDPVAGHIPGAINRPFRDNLRADGTFKPREQLRAEWLALLGGRKVEEVVHQCGSGVTACHNLLAWDIAGLSGGALYAGSWSEWCMQPGAPLARD
jgi:thiosulfate/3-mercaptopyruvate sulfurtransferase